MAVKQSVLEQLEPYLEPGGPNDQHEWGMKCPLHNDTKRSASLNVDKGLWYCQACDIGGPVASLIRELKKGNIYQNGSKPKERQEQDRGEFPYTDDQVRAWNATLLGTAEVLRPFQERRGLTDETIAEFEIGWDGRNQAYTIPVRDEHGELVSIRWYQLDPADDRRKIWSVAGWGEPVLYPIDQLIEADDIIWCEGELDALLTIQNGYNAITRTGGAKVWKDEWAPRFSGMTVYVCQDADVDGQAGARRVATALGKVATTYVVKLPYEITDKHGKDLTDLWQDGHELEDFLEVARKQEPDKKHINEEAEIRVIDSFDDDRYGERLKMRVTVTGKKNPPYLLPRQIEFSCTMDAGPKCKGCSMLVANGIMQRAVPPHDPVLLKMIDSSEDTINKALRADADIVKCDRLVVDVEEYQSLEEIFVRPSMDVQLTTQDAGDYTTRRVFAVGQHDTLANTTVELVGTVHPNPRSQKNEFLAWQCQKVETSIDKFEVTPEVVARLKTFRPRRGQDPMHKMEEIVDDLVANVTRIYGRTAMHIFMDLVFHSALGFDFLGQHVYKGWLDGMIVGDTRTGKSEAAEKLRQHYGLGEMLSCESSTFAGVVGGLTQMSNNAWEVSWGSVPLNDRRIVILDEVSGMTPEQIAQMSSIRSSGVAELTKIRSEKTYARTRLLWLGNPRNSKMADFTYGVQAIRPLVGNNEDIARFDMAMAVNSAEVDPEDINTVQHREVEHVHTSALCNELLTWIWSRTPGQVQWEDGVEQEVLNRALKMSEIFGEDPPLVQSANMRIKLARVAVAAAGRLFSSDRSGQSIVVKREHVILAAEFLHSVYSNDSLGYLRISQEQAQMDALARMNEAEAEDFLSRRPTLCSFLRQQPKFKRSDLEEILSMGRDDATFVMNQLWQYGVLRRDGSFVRCSGVMLEILRRVVVA